MDAEQEKAVHDATLEIGKAVALGLVPYLGQALDIYDTLECIWRRRGAGSTAEREEAEFDLVLSIVGWLPGPGDGVKRSLRLVNRDPQRFAPILFDVLRQVLVACKVHTSPETLLEAVFDADALRAQLAQVKKAVQDSSGYISLPDWGKAAVDTALQMATNEMPRLLGIVQKRLLHWKKLQRNSSAASAVEGKARRGAVEPKNAVVANQGNARPRQGVANSNNSAMAAAAAIDLLNDALGIVGEHIADYYCAEKLGWGAQWSAHDAGHKGAWNAGDPGTGTEGKLSNQYKLFVLGFEVNGNGIDAVWKAGSRNQGKPYAVVEAKADQVRKQPRGVAQGKRPGVVGKLGVPGVPKKVEQLLDPQEEEALKPAAASHGKGGKPRRGQAAGGTSSSTTKPAQPTKVADYSNIMVQMSYEWIEKNIGSAVGSTVHKEFKGMGKSAYSRHLIYTPMWLASAKEHALALKQGFPVDPRTHKNHDVDALLHYEEDEVKHAVNVKKANLRKKYGNLTNLRKRNERIPSTASATVYD